MKRLIAYLFILVAIAACSDGDGMRRQLNELQARNQADSLMTNLPLATTLCKYFDSHGTPNERMLAHYLLGRTYADMGEAPQALNEYHTAADCADTTANDCDYRLLTRIHGQQVNLFYQQLMPNEMLDELDKMIVHAHNAGDTLNRIIALEWKSVAYDLLGNNSDAKAYITQAFNEYRSYGFREMAAGCLPILIDLLIKDKKYYQAKQYMDVYESDFSPFRNGKILQGKEIYCYYKGNYYVGINMLDSADYYYRELVRCCHDKNNLEAAYQGFYELFKLKGETDSVAKYADLCYQVSNERFRQSCSEQLGHMQSLYNYSRYQIAAKEKIIEAEQNRQHTILLLFVLFIIVLASLAFIGIFRHQKQEELSRLHDAYQHTVAAQEQAKYDLIQMQRQQTARLLEEKQQEIDERQQEIDRMRQMIDIKSSADFVEKELVETAIYRRFHELSKNVKEKVNKKDWMLLCQTVKEILPDFHATLFSRAHINEKDYYLCILLRLHFSLSEIGILLDETPQYISKKRRQLLYVLFKQDGKPDQFDKLIQSKIMG